MLKKQARVLVSILLLFDLLLIGGSWNLAYFIRFYWLNFPISLFGLNIPGASSAPEFMEYFRVTIVVVVIGLVCFVYSKMYNPKRVSRYKAELRSIFRANLFLFIILTGITFYYREFSYSRIQSIYFLLLNIITVFSFRSIVRLVLSQLRKHGKNLRRVLIVGSGLTAQKFIEKVYQNRELGFDIVGYIYKEENPVLSQESYLGRIPDLANVIEKLAVDQVFIALDSNQQSDLEEINRNLAEQMVDLNIVPDIYHTLNINPEILDLDGMPIIAIRQSSVEGWNRILKRGFDLLAATVITIMLTPFWIILPILIKLTSPGPVFYFQERMGLDGKPFKIIKFRSMRVDAESETGAVWAKQDDDRRTRLGTFIRKTSLDELPQLFNVIQGVMSLVGPRPERPVFIEDFKKEIPNYMLRHKTKAGMTGWAQVNGWRGNTSLNKRIEFDIYYLAHWSILFDLKILVMTVFMGVINKNAY